ncbi:response regulator [Desulfococcaceae bacterium HSG8]|nr:response regulator [Desulfococcaceae bacterium HSG8]
MKTILVVDDDKMILRLASEALRTYGGGYKVLTAANGKEALQVLNESGVDLVVTDLKMPVMDGYEFLSHITKGQWKIPIIVMTGFNTPGLEKRLKQKGVLHFIEKPFEINNLREKIAAVFTASSKGFIHGFTLANFLQTVEVEQKSITLRIKSKSRVGYLHLQDGELTDAEADDLRGENAAIEILCWDDAHIEILGIHDRDRSIDTSLMQILLRASKIKDEKSESARPYDDELEEAIRLAEGHHFKEAQGMMASYLKKDPQSHRGWLWCSRIVVSMKSIEAFLGKASKLSPKDTDIIDEIKKVESAKKRIKAEQVRRCPFCWSPIEMKSVQCHSCKAHLLIHNNFFAATRNADREILKKAIERYTRVIGRERNINAHYYLSIAHLNLEHWEETLNLFHKTVKLAPEKKIFSDQLRRLLDYMALESSTDGLEREIPARKKPEASDSDTKKKKILVVEDSPTTRKVISITLGQKGYEIIEARDGLEALSRLNEESPDLILLDIILPKMDGYKILSIIKDNDLFKDIPVIMLTSKDGVLSKWKGKRAGATAYLTKPFKPENLVQAIEKYL